MNALTALVDGLVDYAGLFPPAGLEMRAAVREYVETLNSDDAWRVGRFVLPASRLAEFAIARKLLEGAMAVPPLGLNVLLGSDADADVRAVRDQEMVGSANRVHAVEVRLDSPTEINRVAEFLMPGVELFVEIPLSDRVEELVAATGAVGARAKVRTGGVTKNAFPDPRSLVRFMRACLGAGVAFKATAGLHHPLSGRYRLTYESSSAEAWMYGYVNVFLTATLLECENIPDEQALALLSETDATAFGVQAGTSAQPSAVTWKGHAVTATALLHTRTHFALSFGSCSIREPIDELAALGFPV